jgi:hypothetical protein
MEFFDCNYWVDSTLREEDKTRLKEAGITKAIITNISSLKYDSIAGNSELSGFGKEEGIFFCFVLVPEIYFLLDFKGYIAGAIKSGVRLFRFFPRSHLFNINDLYMEKILGFLSERHIPVMLDLKQFDLTANKNFAFADLEKVMAKNPGMPVILEASLKQCMFNRIYFPLLDRYENLYIETSDLLLMDQIENMVEKFGPKRFVFGTGYPTKEARSSSERILDSQMDDFSKRCISFDNLDQILRRIEIG